MSTTAAAVAPERQLPVDLEHAGTDCPVVSPLTEPAGIEHARQGEELAEPKGMLSFLLIGCGIAIYFIAIAAFASFPGVAAGVVVMVLGGIVYASRGLGRQLDPDAATWGDQVYLEETPEAFPITIEEPGNDRSTLSVTPDEFHVTTHQAAVSA